MASLKKIKRRALQGVVRENLRLIHGRVEPPPRRGWSLALTSARLFFFVGVPVALFASSYVLATVAESWWSGANHAPNPEALERAFEQARRAAARAVGAGQVAAVPPADVSLVAAGQLDPAVFPLTMRKIVLDPGHGGDNLGTVAAGGLMEKDLTLDIARRLRVLLEERSFEVEMTRESDESVSLEDRAHFANRVRGDVFISIHVNWLDTRQVRGVETFFLGPTDDPRLNELAARENLGSGYSLADLRLVIEQVYAQARQGESRRLAAEVQRALFRSLGRLGPGLQDRGVKTAPFGVLIRTEMPAILAEVSCLSNEREARLLSTAEYRQYIAEALFAGVESYSKVLNQGNRIGG